MIVVDASTVVAAVHASGAVGEWAAAHLAAGAAAPDHLHVEVASALRRHELAGGLSRRAATELHHLAVTAPVVTYPYLVLAQRVWELRANLTPYDAAYVALAEALDAPLVTLDARLARAPGPRCSVLTPP